MRPNVSLAPLLQIASSLMYIHSKKVLHRDLKTQVSISSAQVASCTAAAHDPETFLSMDPFKDL